MSKKATPEIKEFAKKLFMEPGNNGHHAYSRKKITDAVNEKFKVSYAVAAIDKWCTWPESNGISWHQLYTSGVALGVTAAQIEVGEREEQKDATETVEDKLAAEVKADYKFAVKTKFYTEQVISATQRARAGKYERLVQAYHEDHPEVKLEDIPKKLELDDVRECFPPAYFAEAVKLDESMQRRKQQLKSVGAEAKDSLFEKYMGMTSQEIAEAIAAQEVQNQNFG